MTRDLKKKLDKRSINEEKPLNSDRKLRKNIDDYWRRDIDGKVVNKKPLNLDGKLKRKIDNC